MEGLPQSRKGSQTARQGTRAAGTVTAARELDQLSCRWKRAPRQPRATRGREPRRPERPDRHSRRLGPPKTA
eukprot:1251174-Pyramimonas_sp.AAC.1